LAEAIRIATAPPMGRCCRTCPGVVSATVEADEARVPPRIIFRSAAQPPPAAAAAGADLGPAAPELELLAAAEGRAQGR
jgi:hypothetical protein